MRSPDLSHRGPISKMQLVSGRFSTQSRSSIDVLSGYSVRFCSVSHPGLCQSASCCVVYYVEYRTLCCELYYTYYWGTSMFLTLWWNAVFFFWSMARQTFPDSAASAGIFWCNESCSGFLTLRVVTSEM